MYTDGPLPEQIFSIVKSGETKISLKSGYGELFDVAHSGIAQHLYDIRTMYMYSIRAETICIFVILHIATSNIAIYCIIAILVYHFM